MQGNKKFRHIVLEKNKTSKNSELLPAIFSDGQENVKIEDW